jgi:hypothetical protein
VTIAADPTGLATPERAALPGPSVSLAPPVSADRGKARRDDTTTYRAGRVSSGRGLTTAGAVVVAGAVVALGCAVDGLLGDGPGRGLAITYVAACALIAGWLRLRALGTALVAPPLLFATATAALAWSAGHAPGVRQLALEVATTLAVSAPTLFAGVGLAAAITLVRVVLHVARRPR